MTQTESKMNDECLKIQAAAQRLFQQLSPNEDRQNTLLQLINRNSTAIAKLQRELRPLELLMNAPDVPEQELQKWVARGKPSSGRVGRILGGTSIARRRLSPLGVAIAISTARTKAQAEFARTKLEIQSLENENRNADVKRAELNRIREQIKTQRSNLIAQFSQLGCGPSTLLRSF